MVGRVNPWTWPLVLGPRSLVLKRNIDQTKSESRSQLPMVVNILQEDNITVVFHLSVAEYPLKIGNSHVFRHF